MATAVGHSPSRNNQQLWAACRHAAWSVLVGEETYPPFRTAGRAAARGTAPKGDSSPAWLRFQHDQRPGWDGQNVTEQEQLQAGEDLYRAFNRFGSARIEQVRHPRLIPPVVVELGELAGLIYRSDKWRPGSPRTYIHFMESPPRLVSNVEGTQLYLIGGDYRITARGIEG